METKHHLVLVDDHVVVRTGLRELIQKLGPYVVVKEFDSGEDLLRALPFKDRPDLIILDLSMPGINGDRVMEELNKRKSSIPVLVLTLNSDENMIVKLFRLGVRGFLPKNCTAAVLRNALEEIFATGYFHNEFLVMSLQKPVIEEAQNEQQKILSKLTTREKQFLRLVCDESEYTYEQIAAIMGLQHRTVDGHRESIFEKFKIKSKTGMVLFVLKHKLIDFLQAEDVNERSE